MAKNTKWNFLKNFIFFFYINLSMYFITYNYNISVKICIIWHPSKLKWPSDPKRSKPSQMRSLNPCPMSSEFYYLRTVHQYTMYIIVMNLVFLQRLWKNILQFFLFPRHIGPAKGPWTPDSRDKEFHNLRRWFHEYHYDVFNYMPRQCIKTSIFSKINHIYTIWSS